jgi:2-octaprenyl-6-methoxyphenol hydroxylase
VNHQQVDILIIGGGLIGATLLLALEGMGYSTLLVEAQPFAEKTKALDARTLALSPSSVRIAKTLHFWHKLLPCATSIDSIHVSQAQHFGGLRLQRKKEEALGYVVEMSAMEQAIHNSLPQEKLLFAKLQNLDKEKSVATLQTEKETITIQAKLIVAADGSHSLVRQCCQLETITKSYQQQAIVANVGLKRKHQNRAFERFTKDGVLALLPLTGLRSALVWALPNTLAEKTISLSDNDFLSALQKNFGGRLGKFNEVGRRSSFPLQQICMQEVDHWPVIFVGNAAQTLHPIAGQGFNLGLRDVATLAQCILKYGLNASMLKTYRELRQHDQYHIIHWTDTLVNVFQSRLPGMGFARSLGLMALDNMPMFKKILAHYASGFAGFTPDLVCERTLIDMEPQ